MHVLQALEYLIDDVLFVDIFEDVRTDHSVQVGVHEVEDKVDVAVVFGANYILEPNYVLMASQLLQKDNLTEGALGVSSVLECVEVLLEGDNLLCPFVNRLPNDTIGSLSYEKTSTNHRSVARQSSLYLGRLKFKFEIAHHPPQQCLNDSGPRVTHTEFSNSFSSTERKCLLLLI